MIMVLLCVEEIYEKLAVWSASGDSSAAVSIVKWAYAMPRDKFGVICIACF